MKRAGASLPDERVLYKKAFGKREKAAEELDLEFFYPDGFAKTDSRPSIVFFFGGGWTGGEHQPVLSAGRVPGVPGDGGHLRPVPAFLEESETRLVRGGCPVLHAFPAQECVCLRIGS